MLTAGLVALGTGLALQPVAIALLRRRGVLDQPTERSSHALATVRGGGVAVVLALILSAGVSGALDQHRAALVLLATGACALVGLGEDVRGIPVAPRFILLLLGCLPLGFLVGAASAPVALFAILAVIFAVATVNAVNFMDGINGISAAQGVVGGVAFALLAASRDQHELALVAAATAGACLSFAPFNLPRARVFLGDTGSYGLGAVLAGAVVLLLVEGLPVEAALAPLALYLADTGTTLLRRFRAGDSWHLPHRTHVYQRLTDQGFTHAQVSALVLGLLTLCAALGALSLAGGTVRVASDIALVLIVVTYLALPRLVRGRRTLA